MPSQTAWNQRQQRRRWRGRAALIGLAFAAGLGVILGLIVGLLVNPPTAWFAVLELGLPCALVGAELGWVVGAIICHIRLRSTR